MLRKEIMSIQSRKMQGNQKRDKPKNKLMKIIEEGMRACGVDEDGARDSQE